MVVSNEPTEGVRAFLERPGPRQASRLVGAFLRHQNRVIGGVVGEIRGPRLKISMLWSDPVYRQPGDGTRLVLSLEAHAFGSGAKMVSLSTTSFQAPGFYKKLGYDEYVYGDCPIVGTSTHIMRKALTGTVLLDAVPVEEHPKPADVEAVRRGLDAHNAEAGPIRTGFLSVHWEDLSGAVTAAAGGFLYGDWLYLAGTRIDARANPAAELETELFADLERAAAAARVRAIQAETDSHGAARYLRNGFKLRFSESGGGRRDEHHLVKESVQP